MPRHLLTAAGLKSKITEAAAVAKAKASPVRIGDGDGLMLVVRPNGEASWVLRYTHQGARNDITIGRWPGCTLKIARDRADAQRERLAAGADPAAERKVERERRAEQRSDDMVRKLLDDWLGKQRVSAVYRGNIEAAMVKDVLPAIGAKPPHQVEREDILRILRAVEARGALEMVRRLRMWLRQMFEYGVDDERRPLLKASPVPMGTLRSFAAHKARSFPAVTDVADVPALMRAIRRCDNSIIRTALLMSAYLFQRPTEIREAVWSEFDFGAARWVIPAERMKGRAEHWVPLPRQVLELLRVHQGVVGDEGCLFPGRRGAAPLSEGTLLSRLIAMGYEGLHTPHGFRAMARTILDEHLHVDPRHIEKQLAHEIDPRLRGAYNRAEYWQGRVTMMQAWADWLDAQ